MVQQPPIKSIITGKALVYPEIKAVHFPEMLARKPFEKVCGITLHYTAGKDLKGALSESLTSRIGYHLVVDFDGSITQTAYFSHRVAHAGVASWLGLSPNSYHLAIAFVSWGKLSQDGKSWTGEQVPAGATRVRGGERWHKATAAQEAAMMRFCIWACQEFAIHSAHICGHSECAPGRKVDPGGSLSLTMDEWRSAVSNALKSTLPPK